MNEIGEFDHDVVYIAVKLSTENCEEDASWQRLVRTLFKARFWSTSCRNKKVG